MTPTRRQAPDPEWVLMYRRGVPAPKIAAAARVASSVVRYHLAIAAKQDPGLRAEHQAAVPVTRRQLTLAGHKALEDTLALYQAEGRLPNGRTTREKALGIWLHRRRQQTANGTLSPAIAAALDAIPGWRNPPTKQADDQARWAQRLGEVAAYLAAGNRLPRYNKTDDREERLLGVWLHTQRMDYRAGRLAASKEAQLNEMVPDWREGRPRSGSRARSAKPQQQSDLLAG